MKALNIAAATLALTVTLGLAAAIPAAAQTNDNAATCAQLGREVSAAISGTDNADARTEKNLGMKACQFGMWQNGADHYRKALQILGK